MGLMERIKWILFKKKMQEKVKKELKCSDPWTLEELQEHADNKKNEKKINNKK